jgi:nucleoside 2-deoxyribosyltransferase
MDRDYRGVTDQFVNEIVEGDKEDIDKADILLVNFVKPSVGTSMEILYAWERKKEVLVVTENNQISPWLIYHSTKIFKNIQEVVDYLKSSKGEDNG